MGSIAGVRSTEQSAFIVYGARKAGMKVYYEFEFIHPFSDGNERMGRMWHTLLLYQWNDIFAWLPIEELIKERQKEYYDALAAADKKADYTEFVEMMMNIVFDALKELEN